MSGNGSPDGSAVHRRRSTAWPRTKRSPGPIDEFASTMTTTTSTSSSAEVADSLSRRPRAVRGRCRPGVSRNTAWLFRRLRTPRTCRRVVFGRGDVMVTFVPMIRFTSVDLPTFGRPITVTKPERNGVEELDRSAIKTQSLVMSVDRDRHRRSQGPGERCGPAGCAGPGRDRPRAGCSPTPRTRLPRERDRADRA